MSRITSDNPCYMFRYYFLFYFYRFMLMKFGEVCITFDTNYGKHTIEKIDYLECNVKN